MDGPGRVKRGSHPGGGVRDCLQPRNTVQQASPARRQSGGRPPRLENAHDVVVHNARHPPESTQEMLRDLPAALGGYRPPAHDGRGRQRRATSCDAQRRTSQTPPWLEPSGEKTRKLPDQLPDIRHRRKPNTSPGNETRKLLPGEHIDIIPCRQPRRAHSNGPVALEQHRSAPSAARGRTASLVAHHMEANQQFRPYMEDRVVMIDPFVVGDAGGDQWGFFAVYDGHGGSQASDFCESDLHKMLTVELRAALKDQRGRNQASLDAAVAEALVKTFQKVDDRLRSAGAWRLGTTATVCLLNRSALGTRVHCANVGDSRALAVGAQGSWRLSVDHRPTDPAEANRVKQVGGFVSMGRVNGELAVSRALGDIALKDKGVSCRPDVTARDISRDVGFVIGSDGLWDTVSDQDVASLLLQTKQENSAEQSARRLVENAKRRGSTDNIACITVFV